MPNLGTARWTAKSRLELTLQTGTLLDALNDSLANLVGHVCGYPKYIS